MTIGKLCSILNANVYWKKKCEFLMRRNWCLVRRAREWWNDETFLLAPIKRNFPPPASVQRLIVKMVCVRSKCPLDRRWTIQWKLQSSVVGKNAKYFTLLSSDLMHIEFKAPTFFRWNESEKSQQKRQSSSSSEVRNSFQCFSILFFLVALPETPRFISARILRASCETNISENP